MARMITNYEKCKDLIIEFIKDNPTASPGCIYRDFTGGPCGAHTCAECAAMLVKFLQAETERPLSEKEIMFCRIAETGFIERRNDGHLWIIKDRGNGYSTASDITFLELFEWLEVSDRRFDIREYLDTQGYNSHE